MKKLKKPKAIILGAGVAGLAAAWKLSNKGYKAVVIEKNQFIGGMASSFQYKDITLDYGPHKIFSLMEDIVNAVIEVVGQKNILRVKKKSRIYMNGKFLNYPVTLGDLLKNLGAKTCFLCGISYFNAMLKSIFLPPVDNSFEEWVTNRFGKRLNDLIFAPYAQKIWGNPKNLAVELASTRIAAPSLWEIVKQMILKLPSSSVINAEYFYYPKKGVQQIPFKISEQIRKNKGSIQIGEGVEKIHVDQGKVKKIFWGNGKIVNIDEEDVVVSTIPIPILLKVLYPAPPEKVISNAKHLKTRNLILFYLILNKNSVSDDSWLFFPEEKFIFNRIFEQKNFSKFMVPENKTTLCIEITCGMDSVIWSKSKDEIYQQVISQLEETGLVKKEDVLDFFDKRLSFAYPIYDLDFRQNLEKIYDFIDKIENIYTIGRQGAFGYTGTLDSIDMGMTVAKFILKQRKKSDWKQDRQKFNTYIVVD